MAQPNDERLQVNVDFKNFPELLEQLDQMVKDDDTDRSKFLRKLIRDELARRQQLPLFPEETKKKTNLKIRAARPDAIPT